MQAKNKIVFLLSLLDDELGSKRLPLRYIITERAIINDVKSLHFRGVSTAHIFAEVQTIIDHN